MLEYLTSQETAMWSFVNQGQPTARASVMGSKEAQEQHSIWARISAWLTDGVNQGPLPMPWNLRHFELNDTWKNVALELMYGEVPFEQGMDHVQEECQKIVALPRS
ncbi:MAG: hypothetical protein H5T69_08785 [Chloroflexi bacterium]|nr:hypothetical protein [Chloroflexota bacterium]